MTQLGGKSEGWLGWGQRHGNGPKRGSDTAGAFARGPMPRWGARGLRVVDEGHCNCLGPIEGGDSCFGTPGNQGWGTRGLPCGYAWNAWNCAWHQGVSRIISTSGGAVGRKGC